MTHDHDDFTEAGSGAGEASAFGQAALAGLGRSQKTLPCQFLYDERGSDLFEQITALPEYYPTRTEASILEACAAEIAADTPEGAVLVEFGSGSSRKTEIILKALGATAYVPIDVSASALEEARDRLSRAFPSLAVYPIVGDFRSEQVLPPAIAARPRLGFFPGSTIGNFTPPEAVDVLRAMASALALGGRLIIGVDLRKDLSRLLPAYDDAAGVTAAFNLNLLVRANRELGADFDLLGFAHSAIFDEPKSRIEMHLVSQRSQTVSLLGRRFTFRAGETIHTENSHKYSIADFGALARDAGWMQRRVWTDAQELFSVHELVVAGA